MRKLLLSFALAVSVAGCAQFKSAFDTVTGIEVSPKAVYVAVNTFNALEVTAANYLHVCRTAPTTPGCSQSAIAQLIPAVRSGRVARNALLDFMKTHPDALGAKGLYDALMSTTAVVQQIKDTYKIGGA